MSVNQAFINTLIKPEVLAMNAYKVADATGFIKLDAMENPYHWPSELTQQWLQSLTDCPLNRYPDPGARALSEKIKHCQKIPEHCQLLLGNGSDEIIQILLMALAPDACVLSPDPGFVMYRQISQSLSLNYCAVDLLSDSFDLDMLAMRKKITEQQPAIIFLAYPNNPTGNLFDTDAIREIIALAPGLVIVDEAYEPFADASFIQALKNHDNLLIMGTVSKLGLAGLRLGYIAGHNKIIEQLNKIRLPYNINTLTQATVLFALENKTIFQDQSAVICTEREQLFASLSQLSELQCFPSRANFILFKTLRHDANQIFQRLKKEKILIKNLSHQNQALTNCLRVTIGKTNENRAFMHALKKAFE